MKQKIYIHDIPGRLRVRTEAIKHDARAAVTVQDLLAAIPGMVAVNTNPLTGSIIMIYDTNRLTSARILRTLYQNRYIDVDAKVPEHTAAPAQSRLAHTLLMEVAAPKVVQLILDRIVERALSTAFAALLSG